MSARFRESAVPACKQARRGRRHAWARGGGIRLAPRASLFLLLAVSSAGILPRPAAAGGPSGPAGDASVRLVRSDATAIVVEVHFAAPRRGLGPEGAPIIDLPGLPHARIPQATAWPFRPVLVTLPPSAAFTLTMDDPRPASLGAVLPPLFRLPPPDPDAARPATDPPRASPPSPVEVDMDGWLRDRRVVRLVFRPLTPDGAGGSVFHPILRAHLTLAPGADVAPADPFRPDGTAEPARPAPGTAGRFASLYAATLLNEPRVDANRYLDAVRRLEKARRRRPARPGAPTGPGDVAGPPPVPSTSSGQVPDRPTASLTRFVPRPGPDGRFAPPPRSTVTSAGSAASDLASATATGPLPAKIRVRDEGLWSVAMADLIAAGIDPTGTPVGDVSLAAGGVAIPVRVIDDGNGLLDGTDRFEFYGVGVANNEDTEVNVYRLAFDAGPGPAPGTRDVTPTGGTPPVSFRDTQRFETNEILFTNLPDSDGDLFTWSAITTLGSPVTGNFTFSLVDPDPVGADLAIRFRLVSRIGSSHTTDLLLNDNDLLDSRTWSGIDVTHDATAAVSMLAPGTNTVGVQLSGSGTHQVLANWFDVEYSRLFVAAGDALAFGTTLVAPVTYQVTGFTTSDIVAYDVTDPAAPVRLTGGSVTGSAGSFTFVFTDTLGGPRRFIVRAGALLPAAPIEADQPSNWAAATNGADLIIISHPDFLTDLAPLVAARQAQGLRVALVDVTDAYDEFSFGRLDRSGIKGLVASAFATWQPPAPAYLLLVGNATLDPRQLLVNPVGVPPLMPTGTFSAPTLGVAATDNYFVTVAGADPLPDLHVGRIPAQTPADAAAAVAKILDYDTLPLANLNRKALLVADNDDINFETFQEDLVSKHLAGTRLPVERAYSRLLGTAATHSKILADIDDGALLVNYLGHGNIHNWAGENLFVDTADIPLLTNMDRPFFLTTLNCINGFHAGPRTTSLTSLAEMALVEPGKGAMAAWSPTALGVLTDYAVMSDILFRLIFTDRVPNLGTVTTTAKVEAFTNLGISAGNLEEMTLFGDPSQDLRVDGDRDGLSDAEEDGCACGLNPRDADTDDDGLLDGAEPTPQLDTDADGLIDALDPDADDDGLPDGLEAGVDVPDLDTDLTAGIFLPDLDPLTTTDPRLADTDGGMAPDGAEDRDRDGTVTGTETDPLTGSDDAACGALPPPEIPTLGATMNGSDLTLSWSSVILADPCALYRVLEADLDSVPDVTLPALASRLITPAESTVLVDEAMKPGKMYLVVATRPGFGDGPTGH
ncbi:MAG: C25 family cysteine peptidase [Acidobacteriota bacterium]